MSDLVFPSLPGIDVRLPREPWYEVDVQTSLSGREIRSTYWTAPRYKYALTLTMLRSSRREVETVLNYLARHFGSLDSFLIADPQCSRVSNHGFGRGNGAKSTFQLQRCDEGYTHDALGGPYKTSSLPRVNLVVRSQSVRLSPWALTPAGAASVTIAAPDGSQTADLFAAISLTQSVAGLSGSHALSFWALAGSGSASISASIAGVSATFAASPEWRRYAMPFAASGTHDLTLAWSSAAAAWGVQIGRGSEPTCYISTQAQALQQFPTYWPDGTVDGFEPIFAPGPDVSVFVDGAVQPASAYTLGSVGLVTFGTPPAANTALSWSGSFYRRVRIDGAVSLIRVAAGIYEAALDLVSVR